MTLTRRTALAGFAGLAGALAGCATGGHYHGSERPVTIAAGERGGFYLAFAELLAGEITRVEPRLRCRAVATEASVVNIGRVEDGRADLGLTLADVAQAAVTGGDPFTRVHPLRAIGRVYENYLQLVVRADGPVRTVADLAGRRVSLGAGGSGAAVAGRRLLAEANLTARVRHLPLADAVAALRTGRIEGLLWSGGVPTPALAELARTVPIALLPLDGVLPALRARYGAVYQRVDVPGGAYAGVGPVATIGVANLLVCAPRLPADVAGAVTRVLVGRAANLVPAQAAGTQYLDVRSLIGTGPVPLHPGAAAAYRALHG
ncbi:TAXI family TRAP transporter solute-binding subunit [Prauserella muralis]|uniref:C4-dicarboxylate ABC transporter substrate-binding protein n=1 Tax=Prauserella muralis TaxID=588067 RepID=A0A2V4B1G2_9PSEU|nr:TAXI family TRAP transporter solute-binding subunit [Prauserella muralis]PXY22405.1 C4-dicarboxylate ABC transporter substrate-binding protein [Prauserella muralis]TWE28068.1 hypothetical protein FHX69_0718 [Prauserella muralis]